MSKESNKGLALGVLIGGVIGVITGVLIAPKSGKETREDIKNTAKNVADSLQKEAKKIQEEAVVLIRKAESSLKDASGRVATQTRKHIDSVSEATKKVAIVAKALKSGNASDVDLQTAIDDLAHAKELLKSYIKN